MTLVNKFVFLCYVCVSIHLCAAITKDDIKTSVLTTFKDQFLKQQPGILSENVRVVILNEAEIDDVVGDIGSFKIDLPFDIDVLGKTVRPVELFSVGTNEPLAKLQIVVLVEGKTYFVKAGKRFFKGDIIRDTDVYVELLDMQGKPRRSIMGIEDVIGQEATSVITVGTIMTRTIIRTVPDVKRGEAITIYLMGNGLELKLKGESMEEGYIGDTILIRSDVHKNKTFKGEIIDSSTVQVLFIN